MKIVKNNFFKSVFDSLFDAFVHFDGLNPTDMCVRSKGKGMGEKGEKREKSKKERNRAFSH